MNNKQLLKQLEKKAVLVENLAPTYAAKTDSELKATTSWLKKRLSEGESLEDILPDAFAVVREVSKRVLNMYHFHVQVLGGIALHQGRITQMSTGEGKTLVATMPAYLNSLTGQGVHIVTVNDYLARRDAEWMGKIYKFLGVSVGVIYAQMPAKERREAYLSDITYGTNNEFGFDYLRDNMAVSKEQLVQRGLNFVIIDEVDSILIDEARTPLIISGGGNKSNEMYIAANKFAKTLNRGFERASDEKGKLEALSEGFDEELENSYDVLVIEKEKSVRLTISGIAKAERYFNVENLSDVENTELNHYINQALKAIFIMKRDVDYIVENGEVIIVDEFTGRKMIGRRFNGGLHQAIEAKEGVRIREESKTYATITFQNLFRMYKKMSGMTGTAKTEEGEFNSIYNIDVVEIPTNKPMIRVDYNDVLYSTRKGKLRNIVEDIAERNKTGQPLLIGTISVEASEELSKMLTAKRIKHNVLNAKNHAREAEIVAQAGRLNSVTIATNMAGRGTDILLGGNPDFMARQEMEKQGYAPEQIEIATSYAEGTEEEEKLKETYRSLYEKFKKVTDEEKAKVVELGGLHIIGTERHESRRIDNQLRGRSGRQGDPGSSVFFISLEDDLARLFGGERLKGLMSFFKWDEDEPITQRMITKAIENAQKNLESRYFAMRKQVLQYDDVNNMQRKIIYAERYKVLEGKDLHDEVLKMAEGYCRKALEDAAEANPDSRKWNFERINRILHQKYLPNTANFLTEDMKVLSAKEILAEMIKKVQQLINEREDVSDEEMDFKEVERYILLRVIDEKWMNHIDEMEQMRKGVGLAAIGQQDPVAFYKKQAYEMFEELMTDIQYSTVRLLLFARIKRVERAEAVEQQEGLEDNPNLSLNRPCPCGSGLKYKNCCGKAEAERLKEEYRKNKKNKH
jgi:preprotein translocase subunit SecA